MSSGKAFVFGDNIDTDVLAPGHLMKLTPQLLASHCLEAIDPTFASTVQPGDVMVAGANFGLGSSREQAAVSLKLLGVSAILATSFARIFYRNAMNLGLPCIFFPEADQISAGDQVRVTAAEGLIENLTTGAVFHAAPLPVHLMSMIEDGGLIPHLKRRLSAAGASHV
ncbi:MAG: LeuD/DmdB family oxidoreductase small subunit [Caulobacteraceae bacterium]